MHSQDARFFTALCRKPRKGQTTNTQSKGNTGSQAAEKLSSALTKACMRTFMRSTKIDELLVRAAAFAKMHANASKGSSMREQVMGVVEALDLTIPGVEADSDAWAQCGALNSGKLLLLGRVCLLINSQAARGSMRAWTAMSLGRSRLLCLSFGVLWCPTFFIRPASLHDPVLFCMADPNRTRK